MRIARQRKCRYHGGRKGGRQHRTETDVLCVIRIIVLWISLLAYYCFGYDDHEVTVEEAVAGAVRVSPLCCLGL